MRCRELLSYVADKTKNIAIYVIPFYGDDRPIAVSRRNQWADFVRKKRKEFSGALPNIQSFVRAISRQKIIRVDSTTAAKWIGTV